MKLVDMAATPSASIPQELIIAFNRLNATGKREAITRVQELEAVPCYTQDEDALALEQERSLLATFRELNDLGRCKVMNSAMVVKSISGQPKSSTRGRAEVLAFRKHADKGADGDGKLTKQEKGLLATFRELDGVSRGRLIGAAASISRDPKWRDNPQAEIPAFRKRATAKGYSSIALD